MVKLYWIQGKLQDTHLLIHFHVYKILKINIFFRPEEALLENWWKPVS